MLNRVLKSLLIKRKRDRRFFQATNIVKDFSDWPIDTTQDGVFAILPRIVQHPKIENTTMGYDKPIVKVRKYFRLFGKFGFVSWLKYKINKRKSYISSPIIDGD